jgi:hypothetical protein
VGGGGGLYMKFTGEYPLPHHLSLINTQFIDDYEVYCENWDGDGGGGLVRELHEIINYTLPILIQAEFK